MTNEISIRHAKPEDMESFRALRLEALKNHPDVFGWAYSEAAAKEADFWVNRLKMEPSVEALFFAEQDSQLVGLTGIRRDMAVKAKHAADIWGVYVKPEYRGQHISEALIHTCLEWAKGNKEIVIVKLAVVTHNIPALRCYERCGFTTYGTDPKAICNEGIYYDEYLMSLEIK